MGAYIRKAEEGELGQLLLETVILHSARTQSEIGKALKDAALHYKVDTDAIAQKIKTEFAAIALFWIPNCWLTPGTLRVLQLAPEVVAVGQLKLTGWPP